MIEYLIGDCTLPRGKGNKIIVHVCNDLPGTGGWGLGFVLALSKRWSEPEAMYRGMLDRNLGNVQIVKVNPNPNNSNPNNANTELYVANMIAQQGVRPALLPNIEGKYVSTPPIRYAALRECLIKVNAEAIKLNATLHMPRIGCGLAGSKWELILPIIEDCVSVDVYVYDLK